MTQYGEDQKWQMAGTENTYLYVVYATNPAIGNVGVRDLSNESWRIRVEPTTDFGRNRIAEQLTRSNGWKQPAHGDQDRFSLVVNTDRLVWAVYAALEAVGAWSFNARVNPEAPQWVSAVCTAKRLLMDPVDCALMNLPEDTWKCHPAVVELFEKAFALLEKAKTSIGRHSFALSLAESYRSRAQEKLEAAEALQQAIEDTKNLGHQISADGMEEINSVIAAMRASTERLTSMVEDTQKRARRHEHAATEASTNAIVVLGVAEQLFSAINAAQALGVTVTAEVPVPTEAW